MRYLWYVISGAIIGIVSSAMLSAQTSTFIDYATGGAFDATAQDTLTWGDGSLASFVWTFDVSGTDTTMTFGSANLTLSHDLTIASGGQIFVPVGSAADPAVAVGVTNSGLYQSGNALRVAINGGEEFAWLPGGATLQNAGGYFGWRSTLTKLYSDANDVLDQRNGTNAQTFNIYGTFTNSTNFERLTLQDTGSNAVINYNDAGTGAVGALLFQHDGTSVFELPNSTVLRVEDDKYIEFVQDADPTGTDCDAAAEHGRITVNDGTAGTAGVYVCDQAGATTGWILLHDLSG